MAEASDTIDTLAESSRPIDAADERDMIEGDELSRGRDEGGGEVAELRQPSHPDTGTEPGWLRRCYGVVRKFVRARAVARDWDVEAADTAGVDVMEKGTMLEPTEIRRKASQRTQSKDKSLDVQSVRRHRVTAERNRQPPIREEPAAHSIKKDSCPRLLSDAENERMNKKIDRLMAAIQDHRPIHFEPDAQTGEVQIFADREVIAQDNDYEIEQDIALSTEDLERRIRNGIGVRPMESPDAMLYAESNNSWASMISESTSSNAWEREIAAANVRYALENGGVDPIETPLRHPFRIWPVAKLRQGRLPVRNVSPIPLDFHKSLRASTPSIYSNGSEQDTSSPLFGKSCERILRDTYAQPPEWTFKRESAEQSQLHEMASISESRDAHPLEASAARPPNSARRAFGVFQDDSTGSFLSKAMAKSTTRAKALKDISNLRRPGYLQFNSFAEDSKSATNRAVTPATIPESLFGSEGNSKQESPRAYISKRWPGLLDDRSNGSMLDLPRLDGAARRRNEQAIGRPIDPSLYALSHPRTSVVDSSLVVSPTRQAHFDLALARLEGRALPPRSSPIERHPDWVTLHDRDIEIEEGYRPLPLHGPRPSKPAGPALRRPWWRNSR